MNEKDTAVRTTLRIPGNWSNPGELLARLPDGVRLTPEVLVLPDGAEIGFSPMPPDDQFPRIFRSSCRQPTADGELEILDRYTVNVGLTGPGGSLRAALIMMEAGAAIVRAGGAGVFIDNSGLAHGGRAWLEMAEDSGPDAVSFAYVGIVRGRQEVWTMGMNVLGLPDLVMRCSDTAPDTIVEVVRYLASGEKPMGDGHVVADENGLRFQVVATGGDQFDAGSPMHNPFGRLKLVSIKEIAEGN
jgi:hypothetical protein